MQYNPRNWYWKSSDGKIYSSANQSLINPDDHNYTIWLETNTPTPWPKDLDGKETNEALAEVLEGAGLTLFELSLNDLKQQLSDKIDRDAENAREKFITPGAGQMGTYLAKNAEAESFLQAESLNAADPKNNPPADINKYPMLAASLIGNKTAHDTAIEVQSAYQLWLKAGALIESIRLTAKANINAAKTVAAAQKIVNEVEWPSTEQNNAQFAEAKAKVKGR